MTLSQIIKLKTNSGRDVVDFLVDVMQDRYEDFRICHRLQAARLLTTYGNEDAPDFIDDNPRPSSTRRNRSRSTPTRFDTELARVIREDTDDGRSVARFLVNVMDGELKSFRPHHRMAAARELLDRGFGKSARKEKPVRPEPVEGSKPTEGSSSKDISQRPPLPEGEGWGEGEKLEYLPLSAPQNTHPPVVPAESLPRTRSGAGTQRGQGGEALTPHSYPLTPIAATDILDTLTHLQPEHFEQTVLDLLEAIGYGRAHHLGRTGDGGIDGIINPDPLGLDSIYVQAKRWTKVVGEPEIRTFSGSLDPHGATRGLLITTSGFTETARRTAETISAGNKHIRLVDGEELAQLMISLHMGVETVTAHRARKLDEDHPAQHT